MAKKPLDPSGSVTTKSTPLPGELKSPLTYVEITQGTKGEIRFAVRVHDEDPDRALEQSKTVFQNLQNTFNQGAY